MLFSPLLKAAYLVVKSVGAVLRPFAAFLDFHSAVSATNSLLMKRKSLDRSKPKQAGYSWRLFIPMKTQLTDTSPLTLAMLL